jgi:hypothetical protein
MQVYLKKFYESSLVALHDSLSGCALIIDSGPTL